MKPISVLLWTLAMCALTRAQSGNPAIEALKCTEYKKRFFEVNHTWSTLEVNGVERTTVEDKCDSVVSPFIVGGTPARPREFPIGARLGHVDANDRTDWFCGGTLISERYVLTAAHCFYTTNGIVNRVRLGELDFSTDTDDARPEDYAVLRNIPHPDYDGDSSHYNDIGLVLLARTVEFDAYKHPACLPTSRGNDLTQLVAIGWGQTKNMTSSEKLQKVGLDRIGHNHCNRQTLESQIEFLSEGINFRSQLCAGSNYSRDTCYGDSGGPLMASHEDYPCMFLLVGITSTSLGSCAVPNLPGIYTRVYNFMPWIKSILRW